jgi:predicted PurR-regulated permease PerM
MREQEGSVQVKTKEVLLILASSVIIIAGIKAAESILVPILLSAFIAIISSPLYLWMLKKKIPKLIAIVFIILVFLSFIFLFGLLIGTSVADFTQKLPQYQAKLESQTQLVIAWLIEQNILESDFRLTTAINPGSILKIIGDTLNQLSGLFTTGFLIVFIVVFMLLEASEIPSKLRKIFRGSTEKIRRSEIVYYNINKYIGIKTVISVITGFLVYIFLLFMGIDYPLLWGVLAFAFNYIPNIGSIIAAIPPILLTIVQFGFLKSLWVLVGYIVINTIMGNILEPKFMGKGLGLSTLVVFLSLIFWGWLLGPIGMLLSVPLTITIKIALESSEETKWLAILLGSDKEEK